MSTKSDIDWVIVQKSIDAWTINMKGVLSDPVLKQIYGADVEELSGLKGLFLRLEVLSQELFELTPEERMIDYTKWYSLANVMSSGLIKRVLDYGISKCKDE